MVAKKVLWGVFIVLCGIAYAQNPRMDFYFPDYSVSGFSKDYLFFDSLNCCFVGNWPFGPAYAVSFDVSRNLCFLGSGGGVYILNVANPATPIKFYEAIQTRGIVRGLFYFN
ncbi:MAG: hypothetical protein NZ601_05010, partial [candidate division WOR-3 bacterium]|nr:hypothetical protein [candidate division WOR-3 bacterium]